MQALEPRRTMFEKAPVIQDELSATYEASDPRNSLKFQVIESLGNWVLRRKRHNIVVEPVESSAQRLLERTEACKQLQAAVASMMDATLETDITPQKRAQLEDNLTWSVCQHVRAFQRLDKIFLPFATTEVQALLYLMNNGINPLDGLSSVNALSPIEIIARAENECGELIEPTEQSVDFVERVLLARMEETAAETGTIDLTYVR